MKFYLARRADREMKLLSKKNATKNIRLDICGFFRFLGTLENIRNVDQTLGPPSKHLTLKKSRVTNSITKEKSGGYRLYFIVSESQNQVILSSIYSKKAVQNYSKEEIKNVFKATHLDIQNQQLIPFICSD